jgi:hypothetical protein
MTRAGVRCSLQIMGYRLVAGVVFGVNLLPAFGPPTWAVLVFFRLQSNLAAIPLVLIGALAAACGRLVLAHGSRRFRSRLSPKRIENLEAVRDAIAGGPKRAVAGLALFALSPVPSAQLFAAGLVDASLVPLTAVFFAGRIISYTIYATAASAAEDSLGSIMESAFTSPLGIALRLLALAGLVALLRIDWPRIVTRRRDSGTGAGARADSSASRSESAVDPSSAERPVLR